MISKLKKTPFANPYLLDMTEAKQLERLDVMINYTEEMDVFRSFVKTKSNRRWTLYAMDKNSGIIIAWHSGKRTDEDFKVLFNHMSHNPIDRYYADDWDVYKSALLQKRES